MTRGLRRERCAGARRWALLLLLLGAASAQYYPLLQVSDLTCCLFRVFFEDGPRGFIGFNPNGTTKYFRQEKNGSVELTAWSMGTDRIPILYGVGNYTSRVAVRLTNSMRDKFAKWHAWGRAFNNNQSYITSIYLEQLI